MAVTIRFYGGPYDGEVKEFEHVPVTSRDELIVPVLVASSGPIRYVPQTSSPFRKARYVRASQTIRPFGATPYVYDGPSAWAVFAGEEQVSPQFDEKRGAWDWWAEHMKWCRCCLYGPAEVRWVYPQPPDGASV